MFVSVIVAHEYVTKHLSDEPNTNFLQLNLDEKGDIFSVLTYRKGKHHKTLA